MKVGTGRRTIVVSAATVVIALVALAVMGAGGIVAWEYQNSDEFCTNACHKVHPEEPRAHAMSFHARVKCVECHEGRRPTLELMASKSEHVHQLWEMITGYERPMVATALRPLRASCEGCHWPSVVHDDSLRVRVRYATDPASIETRYRLEMHTGFGAVRDKPAKGIHWHIQQEVTYAVLDPQRQKIPWVQVRGADGQIKTYVDSAAGVSLQDIEKAPKSRIECADCHNAVGHSFPNPADLVDDAITGGQIDRGLPSAKARAVALIEQAVKLNGTWDELAPQFDKLIAESVPPGEQTPEVREQEQKFATAMKAILLRSSFAAPGVSWKSFPTNVGHRDFPGCFRCHDGKHMDEKGQAIRLQCTLCHGLPQVVREDGARSVASTVSPDITMPPPFHNRPNFMRDHPSRVNNTCSTCHGPIKFGKDGGSFCANPACHGRKWPELTLTAK